MHLKSRHCQAASICVIVLNAGAMLQLWVSHCDTLLAQLVVQTFHTALRGLSEAATHK